MGSDLTCCSSTDRCDRPWMTEAGTLEMLQGSNSETIIVKIADLLSTYGVLPALLGGTILAGILASTMFYCRFTASGSFFSSIF